MKNFIVKDFTKSKVNLSLPYLLQVQKESWEIFWKEDLKNLFSEISPIRDYTKKELELWFLDYKFDEPKYKTDFEAKENDDSFEASLRVRTRLVNLKTKDEKEQEIFLSDFPLMTNRGTFIVNGVERVVISQLIRSPGVFFTAQNIRGQRLFGAKIIPNRGSWLEFDTDLSGFIGVKIDRRRRVPATTLLRIFGINSNSAIEELFQDVDTGQIKYIQETILRDPTKNQSEAFVEVYKRLRPGDMATPDTARELIENMFFNFERYDISEVGRWKTWQRLPELKHQGSKISLKDRILSLEDVIATIREIIRLNNTPGAQPDQIDHLGNRRVRRLNELLANRVRVGLMRMARIVKDRMSTLEINELTPSQLINSRPVIAAVKEFFASSQMSQFMDNENPLSELEQKRRLTATGPGGLTRERAGFEVRDVQPSHYGRICPIESPEGQNIGLVGHLASYARINKYGFIETPYFKVKNGRVTSEIQYLSAYEEEKYNIAHAGTKIDKNGNIVTREVEARVKGEPKVVDRENIDFIDVSSWQSISAATGLIPFLRNDDANRALMGSNMQRQAVPLIRPQRALVCSGLEENVAKDSGQVVISDVDGIVTEVDANHITIKSDDSNASVVVNKIPIISDQKEDKQKKGGNTVVYNLHTFVRTNQYTCFHQKPRVKKGQHVKRGDLLADGGAIDRGYLALGQNILVAFMCWRGGNYEDAVIISERLVKDDRFTSIHIESFVCDVRETKLGPEMTTSDIPNVGEEKLKDLDEDGIIRVGAEVGPNDILVGKISPKGEAELTPEERLLRAIFGEKARDVKDTSLLMEHGKRGRVISTKVFSRKDGYHLDPGIIKRVQVEVAQLRKIRAGDKLSGRHGNKGVISKVLPEEDMPFMADGTPIDIILNPLSVASRMNLGQILETHLGWAADKLGYIAVTPPLAGADENDIKEELKRAGLPEDGKVTLYDGQTGKPFLEKVTVGYNYILKLNHMVEDKIHMRSIGPYSLITQQPLGGKAQFGGQRFGEMEVWALEGYGAAYTLQEMLTIKSDDVAGRAATYESILKGEKIKPPSVPASFNLLVNEMKALALSVEVKEKPAE